MQPLRVLIIADDPYRRAGLNSLLSEADLIDPLGQVALTQLSPSLIDAFLPDVLLIDAGESLPQIRTHLQSLDTPGVILVDIESYSYAHMGNLSIVDADAGIDVLGAALQAAAVGLTINQPLQPQDNPIGFDGDFPYEDLTPREMEVLHLIQRGMTNRAIGQVLSIKESTVKFHVNGILEKLGAQSRTEAVLIASNLGLITY